MAKLKITGLSHATLAIHEIILEFIAVPISENTVLSLPQQETILAFKRIQNVITEILHYYDERKCADATEVVNKQVFHVKLMPLRRIVNNWTHRTPPVRRTSTGASAGAASAKIMLRMKVGRRVPSSCT